jgi:hypothetical protein
VPQSKTLRGRTVLVVAPPERHEIFSLAARRMGAFVVCCGETAEALRIAHIVNIDGLVVEVGTAGVDPIELLRQLGQLPHQRSVRAVAIGADAVEGYRALPHPSGHGPRQLLD